MELKLKNRRIQSIGYSFFVSLPKIWLENVMLGKGSNLAMTINNDNKLILDPPKLDSEKEVLKNGKKS